MTAPARHSRGRESSPGSLLWPTRRGDLPTCLLCDSRVQNSISGVSRSAHRLGITPRKTDSCGPLTAPLRILLALNTAAQRRAATRTMSRSTRKESEERRRRKSAEEDPKKAFSWNSSKKIHEENPLLSNRQVQVTFRTPLTHTTLPARDADRQGTQHHRRSLRPAV
jgi:hypothetical protein